jgi:hypothetical protein
VKGAAWAPERCEKQIPNLRKGAENCLKIKKEAPRKACYDKMSAKFPREFWDTCRAQIEPVKAEFDAKLKEKYPDHAPGVGGNSSDGSHQQGPNGPGPNGPGPNKGPEMADNTAKPAIKVDCAKVVPKIKKAADACLKTKAQPKRKACFDKVGEEVEKTGAREGCGDAINQLKSEIQQMEAQKYPGEPPSVD